MCVVLLETAASHFLVRLIDVTLVLSPASLINTGVRNVAGLGRLRLSVAIRGHLRMSIASQWFLGQVALVSAFTRSMQCQGRVGLRTNKARLPECNV